MNKSYKYRLYPNKKQEKLIQKTFGCVRYVFNYFLNRRIEEYQNNKNVLSCYKCSAELTLLKREKTWLQEVDKWALGNALRDMEKAYKFFFNGKGFPKYKTKKNHRKTYRTTCDRNKIKFLGNKVQLPKVGKVKIKGKLIPSGRILNATVEQKPSGKFFVILCCEEDEQKELPKTNTKVGIDLGIKDFAITTDGDKYPNPKFMKNSLEKLARLKRDLSRKTSGGKNYEKTRIKVAKIYEKIANQRKDMLHKISKELVCRYDTICVENLAVKNLIKNHKMALPISDVSWNTFISMLEYKCQWYGKTLLQVDRFYPSSKLCSCCGYKNNEVKSLNVRVWECPKCHTIHDRDINASINILNQGLRNIS